MADTAALKAELAALGAATDTGFAAGGEAVERIQALATALEARNPTPSPASANALLAGRWRLLYSSFGLERHTTLARLSFNALPKTPIRVTGLWQEVDPQAGGYDNVVDHEQGSVVTVGRFQASSDARLDVVFTDIVASGLGAGRVPIDNSKIPPLWSDVTYLDEDFRLNRGGFGNLYVLQLEERNPGKWARHG